MSGLLRDLKYSVRMLTKSPGFTAVAILTLALGIGANTAIFSVVNAVLLRPLPYNDPRRLMQIWEKNPTRGFPEFSVSPANFSDWQKQNHVFAQMAAVTGDDLNLTGAGTPQRVISADVSPDLFVLLGVQVELGRALQSGDDNAANPPVVVVSHALWDGELGADPNIIGRKLTLDGKPRTIVGVLPAHFRYPTDETQIWAPLILDERAMASRGAHWLSVIARLKPGVTQSQAQAEMDTVSDRLQKDYPNTNTGWGVLLRSMQEEVIGDIKTTLLILMGAVGLVLLIACANVANLQLARTAVRQRELAVRAALGAGRRRILQQLLTESALLAVAGSALGLLLAWWGTDVLLKLDKGGIPRQSEIGVNLYVLGFTLAAAFVTAILFGLAPALHSSALDLNSALKEGTSKQSAGGGRLRQLLVVSEVALALLLLVGGGLLVRSFVRLMQVSPGFNAENLLTLRVQLPDQKYPKPENAQAFFRDLLGRIKNLPGVEATGAISFLPMAGAMYNLQFYLDGQPPAPDSKPTSAEYRVVTPEYFRAMGIPLLRGRTFTEADSPDSPPVAIINEEMVRRFWPNSDPVGQRISITDRPITTREIVGIVGNVKQFGLDRPARPEMYVTEFQKGWGSLAVVARSKAPPSSLASAVGAQVEALDKDLPVYRVETMEEVITQSVGDRRFSTYLFTLFASLALILATVGIYGVMSYTVAQGTREIGIRMALGAKPADVLRLFVGMGMRGVLLGVGLGIGGALLVTRYLASLLFSVNPIDPATFAAVAILLSAVAFAACYIPARRAMRVDPMVALRYE